MDTYSLYQSELKTAEYHPKVVAYYFKQWNDFRMPFHTHNAVEIMYVIEGKCVVDTDNDSFALKKGDFIVLDANVSHRLVVEHDSPCRMLNIEFAFTGKEGVFPSIKDLAAENQALASLLTMERPYFVLRDLNEVYHTLKSLVLELDERGMANELMVQLLLSQLLIRIARLAEEAENSEPQQTDLYVKKAVAYIHHHYDCDIQVKDIAAAVNLHPGYLHRIFKTHMDCTVMEYLSSQRVEKAKMLLAHTDITVIEISDYIGINSRQYFSSIFKKHTGKSPLEFRKSIEAAKHSYAY
jgi:AraC-like DNA-binding protein/mannose-6-phosphate isomerase-like protein (cupin superfamily)